MIAFDDVPNAFQRLALEHAHLKGVFEAHITVRASRDGSRDEVSRFAGWCEAVGVKHVLIALPRGVCTFQPMTSTYHRGELADVGADVFRLAREIHAAGFDVSRVKLEATGANVGLPQTAREALRAPNGYFEFHMKVVLRDAIERAALEAVVRPFGAHLSRNARFVGEDGSEERFVTLRAYRVGQQEAESMFRALDAAVREHGLRASHRLTEYAVFDSNAELDAGWLDDEEVAA